MASKLNGGLGIGSLEVFNKALTLKWCWRFANERNSLLVRFIEAIYGEGAGILNESERDLGSSTWGIIMKLRDNLNNRGVIPSSALTKILGNGEDTRFWVDVWLGDEPLKNIFPRLFALENNKSCSVAQRLGLKGWRWRRLLRCGVELTSFDDMVHSTSEVHLGDSMDR
ncbi:putative mitochondrial protein AtMg00310 [Bidens hawaiensis]